MTNPLIDSDIAKTAEGKFLALTVDAPPTEFILYKPVSIIDAVAGDNLQYFRHVTIGGVERDIKYHIDLKTVATGECKEWEVGSAAAINQLIELKAEVGDTISIEKIKIGGRKQDVRYKIRLVAKAAAGAVEQNVAAQGMDVSQNETPPADDEMNIGNIPI
ncbi:MAG: hypothetical protein KAI72_09375 [Candidatus Pacebacteria bacterium]|nr:hypothetical protein [Candidatus Paceibacterota bacterium]